MTNIPNAAPRRADLDPTAVKMLRVTHTASGRVSWIGLQIMVTLRNGERVYCDHASGHRSQAAAVRCATSLVAQLNRAAGTSTAAVEAAKAAR